MKMWFVIQTSDFMPEIGFEFVQILRYEARNFVTLLGL